MVEKLEIKWNVMEEELDIKIVDEIKNWERETRLKDLTSGSQSYSTFSGHPQSSGSENGQSRRLLRMPR